MTRIGSFYSGVVLFALGIICAQFAPSPIPAWLSACAGATLIPCCFIPALRLPAWFLAGLFWALFRADLLMQDEWPAALEARDVLLTGTVSDLPQRAERYLKFDLDVEQARFRERAVAFSGRVRLRWYHADKTTIGRLRTGSTWQLTVRLKQPHGYYNPGVFDYESHLYVEGVRATGYVRDAGANELLEHAGTLSPGAVRQRLSDGLGTVLAKLRFSGLLRALALGDRSGVSRTDWDVLRATGTNHLIAISGLHVGLAAGLGGLLGLAAGRITAALGSSLPASQVGAIVSLLSALGYAALSGFEVPAQRAFVMAAVFLLAVIFRRHAFNLRGLAVAALVVLAMNPASVHDPGFWLSFGAVGIILGRLNGAAGTGRRPVVVEAAKLQCVLSLALLPLVAVFFGAVSLVSVPANLVAVPVVMFCIVPLCLFAILALVAGAGTGATMSLGWANEVLGWLWMFLAWLGHLSFSRLPVHIDVWQCLVLSAGVAWLVLGRRGRRMWGLLAGAVILVPVSSTPGPGAFQATVLDVGQGLSVVVRTGGHTLVYDTGARYPGGFSLAEAVVVPHLRSVGVDGIDTVVISHGDNDHRGGFEDLVSELPVRRILSSVADDLAGAEYCARGQEWQWNGVRFEILHPERARPPAHNNASCVVRISGPYGSMLLTGDIEAEAEASLMRRNEALLQSDVLLVPHQGSATSSTPDFIDRVQPAVAVVSAGYINRYGHPHPDVAARYRERGIRLMNTAWSGAVTATFTESGIDVQRWREQRPRFWLDRGERVLSDYR